MEVLLFRSIENDNKLLISLYYGFYWDTSAELEKNEKL